MANQSSPSTSTSSPAPSNGYASSPSSSSPSPTCLMCIHELKSELDSSSSSSSSTTSSPMRKKGITRKRTFSFMPNTPRVGHRGIGLTSPKKYSPRKLDFNNQQHAAVDSESSAHSGSPTRSTSSPSAPRLVPSPPPSLALLALTGGTIDNSDPLPLAAEEVLFGDDDQDASESEDVVEQNEEDNEAELEKEEAKDIIRWWTPAGWWYQICLLLGLAVKLTSILGMSFQWMRMLWRLILFSVALMPAWALIGRTYFTARYIKRGIRYGLNARNFLDVYRPHRIQPAASTGTSNEKINSAQIETLCPKHRALVQGETGIRGSSFAHMSFFQKLHLGALVNCMIGGIDHDIDENALRELQDSIRASRSEMPIDEPAEEVVTSPDRAEEFTAQMTSNFTSPNAELCALENSPPLNVAMHLHNETGVSAVHPTASASPSTSSVSSCFPRSSAGQLSPVVIFLTGGAWSIGYKAWGSLLGLGLSAHGVLVASVDYRNFPQGDVVDMCRDVHTAIAWVFRHAEEYGGDTKRIFLAGQSAGAHLGSLAILQNVEALLRGSRTSWSARHLLGFIGISGCYDVVSAVQHFHDRGLPRWVFLRMMRSNTPHEMGRYSPIHMLNSPIFTQHPRAFQKLMPTFLLIHGKGDKTVTWMASHDFATALMNAKVRVSGRYYRNYSHTDPLIEGPLTGHDHLCHDILYFIVEQSASATRAGSRAASHTNTPAQFNNNMPHRVISPFALSSTDSPPSIGINNHHSASASNLHHSAPVEDAALTRRRSVSIADPPTNGSSATPTPIQLPPAQLSPSGSTDAASRSSTPSSARTSKRSAIRSVISFFSPRRLFRRLRSSSRSRQFQRRPSHLPHPFQYVDDVEEDVDGSPDMRPTRVSLPTRLYNQYLHRLNWLVPTIVHDAAIVMTRPIVDFVKSSPPPPEATESPICTHSPTESGHDGQLPPSKYGYPLQPPAKLPISPPRPLIPRFLIRIARWINPF